MDKRVLNKLFFMAGLGLIIAGGIFLCISMLDGNAATTPLAIALACILFANLLTILRQMTNRKE